MSTPDLTVHFVEPGGEGGVFQHTVEVARLLTQHGTTVVIHTASGHEPVPAEGIHLCGCVNWFRGSPRGVSRRVRIAGSYLGVTLPHLRRSTAGQLVHVQGLFASPLYAITLGTLRRRAAAVLFSPHNTFSRAGRRWEEGVVRLAARRLADRVIAFSAADAERLTGWGADAVRCPLVQVAPAVTPERVAEWRVRLGGTGDRPLVVVPGQIRADKGIDVVIRAIARLPRPVHLAVVGEDKGDLERCRRAAQTCAVDVTWAVGYHPLEDFAAAIASADAVALAYPQASQSGVLSLAASLGTPSVATPVGGLAEYATVTASGIDEIAMADAIGRVLADVRGEAKSNEPVEALRVYRDLLPGDAEQSMGLLARKARRRTDKTRSATSQF